MPIKRNFFRHRKIICDNLTNRKVIVLREKNSSISVRFSKIKFSTDANLESLYLEKISRFKLFPW